MSRQGRQQEPTLAHSELTGRYYIVTDYVDMGSENILSSSMVDITDEIERKLHVKAIETAAELGWQPFGSSVAVDNVLDLDFSETTDEAGYPLWERLHEEPHDEYHTITEIYRYRMLYNAMAFTLYRKHVVKSWRHSSGEECFGGGWFIVVADLPGQGQVSNHYAAEYWALFDVPSVEQAPEYDGHTPEVAADRLERFLESGVHEHI